MWGRFQGKRQGNSVCLEYNFGLELDDGCRRDFRVREREIAMVWSIALVWSSYGLKLDGGWCGSGGSG